MLGKIVDKFRLEAVLGEGGMGIVYRAWDMVLERPVALKMIHRQYTPSEISFKRFLAEAKILAKLDHPHIVPVHDLFEHEGSWFIVMQYVEGMTLAKIIECEGPVPYQRCSPICRQILSALGYAHRAGVTHRDIKPSNVILAREGTIKVTDFGLAKSACHPALTKPSSAAGTLYYMSPEQVKDLATVDHRSDLYALGMTLYEMLTGRTPFPPGSPPVDILNAILQQQFPSPRRLFAPVPEPLSQMVMKALAKNPAKRYQSADEMLSAITQFEHQIDYATTARLPAVSDDYRQDLSRQAARDESGRLPTKHRPPATSPCPRRGKFNRLVPASLGIAAVVLPILFALKVENFLSINSTAAFTTGKHTTFFFPLTAAQIDTPKALMAGSDTLKQILPQPLVAPPAVGAVQIKSTPRGATVIFDGETRETTPQTIKEVAVGDHDIVLKKTGYREAFLSVTIASGKTQNIDAVLLPLMGKLRVSVIPSGAIFIDGVPKRPNAADPYETSLQFGSYRIRMESPQLGFLEKAINIKADHLHELTIDFTKTVKLIVTAFDADSQRVRAEVFVDGKHIGQALQELPVRIGQRVIEVRREGYRLLSDPKEIQLEESIEQPVRIRFTLRKM